MSNDFFGACVTEGSICFRLIHANKIGNVLLGKNFLPAGTLQEPDS